MMFRDYFLMLRFTKPHRKVFAFAVLFMMCAALFDCFSIGMILPMTDRVMIGKDIVFPNKLPGFLEAVVSYLNKTSQLRLLTLMGFSIPIIFFLKGSLRFSIHIVCQWLASWLYEIYATIRMQNYKRFPWNIL